MRRNLLLILGITAMACFLLISQPSNATVYDQFTNVTTQNWGTHNTTANGGPDFALSPALQDKFVKFDDGLNPGTGAVNQFRLYPNPATRPDNNLDDGYAELELRDATTGVSWTYRYNGVDYDRIYISLNGFITFDVPPGQAEVARDPNGLFLNDVGGSIPTNVVAPYWGNHKYWQNTAENIQAGFEPTEVGYVFDTYEVLDPQSNTMVTKNYVLIQWKNLNINYCSRVLNSEGTYDTTWYKGNVASFQLLIFEGPNTDIATQGNMEFRYGYYGPTQSQLNSPSAASVILNPSNRGSVGIKGNSIINSSQSDYVNCLYNGWDFINYPADVTYQRYYATLATRWPASGDPTHAIVLNAHHSINGDDTWGDGDADMSKAEGGRHWSFGDQQNLFVTLSDVRSIMRSVATDVPLDSLYKQDAFHADVHHDGRYYYLTNRNSAIYRMVQASGLMETDTTFSEWHDSINLGTNYEYEPGTPIGYFYSQDTFWLRKSGAYQGDFGFLAKSGENDEFVKIDFIDMPGAGVNVSNSIRTYKLLDAANVGQVDGDYQMRIAVYNTGDAAALALDRELLRRAAYPAVNQNVNQLRITLKKNIVWRDSTISERLDGIPGIRDARTDLFWQADEKDASLILMYLGAKIPVLPWWRPDIEFNPKGKVNANAPYQYANNVAFDNATSNGNTITIPVYFNGLAEDAQSASFYLNTDIVDFTSANADVLVDYSNDTKKAVIVADGYFNPSTPVAYLTINGDVNDVFASKVKFNGEYTDDVEYNLAKTTSAINANYLAQNSPNPVVSSTSFNVTIPEAGNYRLAVYDLNGNVVKVIADGWMEATAYNYNWNATDMSGNQVVAGSYIYRLDGENLSISNKLSVVR
jgi:hypothetical protein